MIYSATVETTDGGFSNAGAARRGREMDALDTIRQQHREATQSLKNSFDSNETCERKSLLKKIMSALAPQLYADERVVYETQSWPPATSR
jgi:hypothetical protein